MKVGYPSIKVQTLSPHEIGATPEDKIPVFFQYKFEDEEVSAYNITSHVVLELRSPISLDPVIGGSYWGLKPHELPYHASFFQSQGDLDGLFLR